ncbi:MAG: adenylate/guanylate cyclase domain-containing protein, partial [Actinomycetota bacterium]|nr:adenylate/guanylate cyclase domain-containing protein [Actinomycetota bacterium]
MTRPKTRYAKTADGVHIAYQVFGEGDNDLVIHFPWLSNVDAVWDLPEWVAVLRSFAEYARVILFDRRGLGVSDRPTTPDAMALEKSMDDMLAVMDETGSERAALLGYQAGGTVMILFAATYPERVSALALYSPLVFYWKTPEFPWGWTEEYASEWQSRVESSWGTEEFWRWNAQGIGQTDISDQEAERYARFTRLCASPQAALAIDEVERRVDVRAILPQIQVPTLVMETRGEVERGEGAGPWIADQIPGARYVEIPDKESFPVRPDVYRDFERFLSQIREQENIFDRVLATVLFTDIVDSTAQSAALGDREWRKLREEHDRIIRAQLSRYRGREIKTMGDGFLATFDGPARAVYCANAIAQHLRPLGIEVRAGLHTGEIELDGDDVRGLAVAIGARVGAAAGPSEVLVSRTVKDLVAGSGLTFEDAGEHELKGVPD